MDICRGQLQGLLLPLIETRMAALGCAEKGGVNAKSRPKCTMETCYDILLFIAPTCTQVVSANGLKSGSLHSLRKDECRLDVLCSHARGWWGHDNLSHHSTHLSSKSKCLQCLYEEEDIDPAPAERRCVCPWVWMSVKLTIHSLWVKGSAFKCHYVWAYGWEIERKDKVLYRNMHYIDTWCSLVFVCVHSVVIWVALLMSSKVFIRLFYKARPYL